MKWDPICECGNPKKVGKAECGACKKARKARDKGKVERYRKFATRIGNRKTFILDGKTFRVMPGGLMVEV